MTDASGSELPGGWEAAAAEYVLGLLPEAERSAFEARLAQDPDLRQDVAAWAEYFSTLVAAAEAVAPPPQVLRRVEAELFATARPAVWRQLVPYALGAVAGAVLAWIAFTTELLQPAAPGLVAELAPVEGALTLVARFDPQSGVLAIDRESGEMPENRVLELWLIAEEGAAPISLGLVTGARGTVMALPPLLSERLAGATLAVSEEPPGGSRTGAPTGPMRAAGTMRAP
jgi:anti-sigma-K factor RskA